MLTPSLGLGAIMYIALPFIWVLGQLIPTIVMTVKFGWYGFFLCLGAALILNLPVIWVVLH